MNNFIIIVIVLALVSVIFHFTSKSRRRILFQKSYKPIIFINGWRHSHSQIYKEFMDALNGTHLLSFSESVSIVRNRETQEILRGYGVKNIDIIPNFDEFNVLEKIIKHCHYNDNNEDFVLYIHFKGSFHDTRENSELRKMLIHYLIKNYGKCITKLYHGADVCGARYSLLPYRHYSGNMWWSKCKYIKTLKPVKYTVFGQRYSVGFNGYNGDRYSAEKWIMSNIQSIPSDLMPDNIEYSYNYGSEYLYKTWIKPAQNIHYSPNSKILYSTVKFNKELNFYPHTYYSLFFNLLYDYEVFFEFNKTNLFNFGWCKGLVNGKSIDENVEDKESIEVVKKLIEYCKIAKGLRVYEMDNYSNIQKYKTTEKDVVYLSNVKCNNEYRKSNNNEYDVICNENNNVNNDYQVIYEICSNGSFNKNIYYSQSYENALRMKLNCDKSKDYCGKWFVHPFRGSRIDWKVSCQFIRNAGKPKYYQYEGNDLEKSDEYYGFNKYSYLHYPLVNPFQRGNCDELDKSTLNKELLYSVLMNSVFDIKSGQISKENIHRCYWWCNCFSFNKNEKISESLNYFCRKCKRY